ncbi:MULTISPECIES: MFS transporter [Chryseobacterium]|uniref:MFS family permease n=1 Tax=Chryseobacterium geocarposphaerae TaxID=1416776 RepID=A0ABU1L9G7_9FLAO|nr:MULTISPECIES: MFS transporter [Chryseobacterium]MDR6403366.1 MFS family permease [Chryseobacterium geocarposphaerae]MDR6696920.1 MFS family permease [Chryseobacterium ginsenosidimutans]
MYNKGLFSDWVPKPVQLLMIALLVIVVMPLGGVYTGNISFMVGGTGALSEYFMFANYATTIGMGASMPIVLRMKMRFKVRNKFVLLLILLGLLNLVNATTLNPVVIVAVSLIIGFLKMMVAIELFLPLMMMIGDRGVFYGVFYTAVLSLNQISGYYAVEVSILYNWQQFFVIITLMCFAMALLCWVLMHNKYFALKVPLHYIDWLSIILFISTFMFSAYVLSFGKQQDWLNSTKIINSSIAAFVSFGLLVVRQFTLKRPYLSFSIFKKSNVLNGLFMLLWLGMFLGTTSLQNIFSVGVLGYDQLTNAKLNLLMIPGLIAAGITAIFWFKKQKPLKMFIFSGFSAMMGYTIIMYFSMVPEFNYENWYLPLFLKGYGMGSLFIAVWFYTLDQLELNDMLAAIGLVLVWRTFLAVGIFSALLSWFQYQFQIVSLGDLAVYMDGMTISSQSVMTNMKTIQLNAILVANKKIFGYIILVGFGVLLYVLTHHFGAKRFEYLRFIRVLSGKSIIAKRRMKERKIVEEIKDAAGSAM